MALRTVRARYSGGMLEPLEALALREDQEVLVTIEDQPDRTPNPARNKEAATDWPDMFQDPDGFIRMIYRTRIEGSRAPPSL